MRSLRYRSHLLIIASLLLTLGLPLSAYQVIEVKEGGTLTGLVKFPGETAPRAMFGTRGDPKCPPGIPQEHLIVKQENRGIKNAIVVLTIEQGKAMPAVKNQLTSTGCRFEPRMQWIPKGNNLYLINKDLTIHNVKALRRNVAQFSVELGPKAQPVRRPMINTGLFKINCDRHLWERAWVYVSDHPYVTVTDGEGRFEIKDIPPGTYEVYAWHEGWIEKGTEHTGQLFYQPMQQAKRVAIHKGETSEVLLDAFQPMASANH